jgi:hypothetical protein
MRILDGRRRWVGLTLCTSFAFAASAMAQSSNTQVETFTAGGTVVCTMPGTANPGAGVSFSSHATLQSVDFAPGSVMFNGTLVDFDGREANFLASAYNATVATPVPTGPAIVLVSGTGTVSHAGGGGGGGGGCLVVGGNTPLGPTFSSSRLDIVTGPGVALGATVPNWNAAVVPQLSGRAVTVESPMNITSVDAVNGIVSFTLNGKIFVRSDVVPALTTLGTIGLAIGLLGLALLALSRRTARGKVTNAG